MPDLGSAVFTLITDASPFERGLRAAGVTADAATAGIGKKIGRLGTSFVSAGRSLTRGLTVPILAIGAISAKLAANYQRDLLMIHTQAGATVKEMHRVDGEVRAMVKSGQTAFSMDDLAKAMYHIESLNYHGAKAYKMLNAAQKGATIGNADLEQTTTALGAAILTHIKGLGSYGHAMGMVMATVGQGNMRLQDFVDAMKSGLVPTAKVAGVSFPSLAAALTVVTDRTGSAAVAANRLRTLLLMVAAPTAKATAALKTMHMSSTQLADDMQKPNGVLVAVKDLAKHLAALPAAERKHQLQFIAPMFGGSRSTGTMATLLSAISSMEKKFPLINKQAKNFNAEWTSTKHNNLVKFHIALAQLEQSLLEIGEKVMPIAVKIAGDFAKKIGQLVGWYNKLSPAGKDLVNHFIELAVVAGPVLMIFGTMLRVISPLVTGFGLLGRAILSAFGMGAAGEVAAVGSQMTLFGSEVGAAGIATETATAAGLIPFAAAAAGIVGIGLAYWFLSSHTAADQFAGGMNKIKAATSNLPGDLQRVRSSAQSVKQALEGVSRIAHRTPHDWAAIVAADGRAVRAEDRHANAILRLRKHMTDLRTGVQDIIKAGAPYANQIYLGAQAQAHAAARTAQWKADLDKAIGSLAGFINKNNASHPGMADTAKKALAIATAAQEVADKIKGIPSFKQIRIQMVVDTVNIGTPPGTTRGTPGNPHIPLPTPTKPPGHSSKPGHSSPSASAMMRASGGGGAGHAAAVSRIHIDNWDTGMATIETRTQNAIDHNNRFLRRST